jgi:error-prone DNA polymerase
LLNSQPMGFYAPAQLVGDARRHGVDVLPVDVQASALDATLAATPASAAQVTGMAGAIAAVRLGLSGIAGLSRSGGERIVAARRESSFADVDELAARAQLGRADLDALAAAGALKRIAGNRRQAAWVAAAAPVQFDLLASAAIAETAPTLAVPSEADDLVADYASLGLSLGRHPLALLRDSLRARRFVCAAELRACGDRQLARVAGIVTCRQRPGTASGIVFVTIEDESGLANIVVHAPLGERQRRELLGASLLGVFGQISREGEVVHLIAKRLVDLSAWLGRLPTASRDFH